MEPLTLLVKLSKELDARQTAVTAAENWYTGNHPIPQAPPNTAAATLSEARTAFTNQAKLAITNFIPPVVDVPNAALALEGFRFGGSQVSTDVEAQVIWQRNHMDADHQRADLGALITGQAFALVWPDPDTRLASITVEHPSQCIVMYEAGSRRRRLAGLKQWVDEDGYMVATLYTQTHIYKFRSARPRDSRLVIAGQMSNWSPREVPGEAWPLPNPYGVVPLVEIRANTPLLTSIYGGGVSEFAKQLTPQKRINQTNMLLLTTMENQSFRQRWATDWDVPLGVDGKPDRDLMLKAAASRLQVFNSTSEDKTPKVGEFAQADFRPFIDVVGMFVKEIATTSGTPPYAFLLGDMINVAADSLARIEGIQTRKVKAHAREFGEAWLEVLQLGFLMEGNPKAVDPTASVVWGEFEERTATEQANLAQIARGLGAPLEAVFAMLPGINQVEAKRWVTQGIADQLRTAAVTPEPVPVPVDGP